MAFFRDCLGTVLYRHTPFAIISTIKNSDGDIGYATTEERDFRGGAGV